jgi:hypothetical protein
LASYFSGDYGLNLLFQRINVILGAALNSSLAYNVAAVTFAALVGLSIYVVVASFQYMVTEAQVIRDEIEFTNQAVRHRVEAILGLRLGLRAAGLLAWSLYSVFFFNIIVPYCVALTTAGADGNVGSTHWLAAVLLLLAASHIHVIFMRLLALRPRVFDAADTLVGRSKK